jgi:hypothetical protein
MIERGVSGSFRESVQDGSAVKAAMLISKGCNEKTPSCETGEASRAIIA